MKITQGIFALLLMTGFSVNAETDNFNISLTGTFDNTVPDNCTVSPIGTVDLGTLNMHDIKANATQQFYMGYDMFNTYDTGATVDITINCTNGTSYNFALDNAINSDGDADFFLFNGTEFLWDTHVQPNTIGDGLNQTFTFKIFIRESSSNDLTLLSGALTATLPITLTVM